MQKMLLYFLMHEKNSRVTSCNAFSSSLPENLAQTCILTLFPRKSLGFLKNDNGIRFSVKKINVAANFMHLRSKWK